MPKGIYKRKEGLVPWNKGKTGVYSPETLNSMKRFGSDNPRFGTHHSKETLEKMKNAQKGEKSYMFGKHPSQETINKLRIYHKNNPVSYWLGKKQPKEMIEKRRLSLSGEKCHLWKGGISPINDTIRKSFEMKVFKRNCLERDNWICQKTGIRGGKLVVHHIFNFSNNPELRFEISNGITLSKQSHKEFHHIYGTKNNTREQLEEFLKNNG